ncbi:sensor histidine kinase [Ekhidna sp. To15]|uniref:sensor histidine kinase n=1 Tax=Ekhidna sp. To15 TaxID=3395267 RepID=UPI003F51B75C
MKLIHLTNRYYFLAFTVAFVVVGFASYYIIKHVIDKEFNEKLHAEKQQFIDEFDRYDKLDQILYLNIGDKIKIHEKSPIESKEEVMSDTSMYDTYEGKMLDYRKLTFSASHDGKEYRVTIVKSLVNNNDLLQAIGEIMVLVAMLFMLSLIVINLLIAKKIWKPFYQTLSLFKNFNIKQPEKIVFPKSKIDEFRSLNQVVENMTEQTAKDYQNLKEYTENASHEIQTPLAIIQNRTELMMQNLQDETLVENLGAIRSAALRLSKLKEGLALFAKIDNHQYVETQTIHLHSFLNEIIENVQDLLEMKQISYSSKVLFDSKVVMNETLAYVLFNNLINNAIKYNLVNGKLNLEIDKNSVSVINTGEELEVDPNTLFTRFVVSGSRKDSTGLGLSLVKRIADYNEMNVSYTNDGNLHKIKLSW